MFVSSAWSFPPGAVLTGASEEPGSREGLGGGGRPNRCPLQPPGAQLHVRSPCRRSPSYIVCNTTSSEEVLEMKVMVQVDKASIHQDLFFQYVEDPTIVRIEPEWSIVR